MDSRLRMALDDSPVARLATLGPQFPHLVPIVFAVAGDRIVSPIDAKPKRRSRLQRLLNIEANPHVSVLVDHYDDDWTRLWWVRLDGRARITEMDEYYVNCFLQKYPQYKTVDVGSTAIEIDVDKVAEWAFDGNPPYRC